jgi:glyoxylate utilization-related uncharacterized protein
VHPHQQETYDVVDGSLEVLVGHEWKTVPAGERVVIPPGTVHTFRNRSGQNVTVTSIHEPAGTIEQYFERLYWLSAMNRVRGHRDLTSALYTSLLLDTHREDQQLAGPAARMGVKALAGVARLLRLKVDR